jgi:hypothetical protein
MFRADLEFSLVGLQLFDAGTEFGRHVGVFADSAQEGFFQLRGRGRSPSAGWQDIGQVSRPISVSGQNSDS